MLNKHRLDIIIFIVLLIAGTIGGFSYLKQNQRKIFIYEFHFQPAVLASCGHGFGHLTGKPPQSLANFLNKDSNHFSCQALPSNPRINHHVAIRAWYFMLMAIALLWKLFGVSWIVAYAFFASFLGLSLALSYAIYRLGMNRLFSLVGVGIFVYLPGQLEALLHFRDLARTPFILFGILIIAYLVLRNTSWKKRILLSFVLGLVIGLGYGFRPDVLILLPPAFVSLLFFLPKLRLLQIWKNILLVLILLAGSWLAASPMLKTYQHQDIGSCFWHFPTLGLATQFQHELNMPLDHYDWLHFYSDDFAYATIITYGQNYLGYKTIIPCSTAYDHASKSFYLNMVKHFPADFIERGFRTIITILGKYLFILSIFFIFLVSIINLRLGLFLILGLLYFFSYPNLQFLQRHFYYRYLWPWWPCGVLLSSHLPRHKKQKKHLMSP